MTAGLLFTGSTFSMGANGFSTANRYPRQVANPADTMLTMVEGPSMAIVVIGSGSSQAYGWRFECGDLTFTGSSSTVPSAGFAVDKPVGL
jgi:hypothetical protein